MKNTRDSAIHELKKELTMRQQVWKRLPGARNNRDVKFRDVEHERRYAAILALLDVLEDMTDAEYNQFAERAKRRQAMAEQPVLDLFRPIPGNDY